MQTLTLSELESFDSKSLNHGKQRRFLCPICGQNKPKDSAHRSLAVNTESGLFICHRCQTKGCLQEFWQPRPIMQRKQRTRQKLMSHFSFNVKEILTKEAKTDENLSEKMLEYQTEFLHSPAEIYLLSRGISTDIATQSGCGYAENWEHWEKFGEKWILKGSDKRVVFPIYDFCGNLTAIHARAINKKHFASSKITKGDKSQGLFLSDADVLKNDTVAICEGAIDAMALQTFGYSAVAMTGTTPPDWFYRKMIFKTVLIATDADEAGEKAALKLKLELESRSIKTHRLRPENAKDWGEFLEKSILTHEENKIG